MRWSPSRFGTRASRSFQTSATYGSSIPRRGGGSTSTPEDGACESASPAAAAEERTALEQELASLGVPHLVLSTAGDWLRHFARFIDREGRR